jgi:hypothetical protein
LIEAMMEYISDDDSIEDFETVSKKKWVVFVLLFDL